MHAHSISHCSNDLIALFDGVFRDTYQTCLVRGTDEPLYLPAGSEHECHRIIFAHGFFASALHEVSHWCIAGAKRRTLEDYGYWYLPDGRDQTQQSSFESVEVAPQALELLFTQASGRHFEVSIDNLNGEAVDRHRFRARVEARAEQYLLEGLPRRAEAFRCTLQAYYRCRLTREAAIAKGRARLAESKPGHIVTVED
ncbi:elongation factor P hydroxylase [Halomonas sp. PR-M31]|uniref:elongation factor P hydroxylase n=1 Tax=Halomonas sp. PR-M31 TaxID=1471202 RepID=UPI0006522A49|nr:elongation factor P hydroxylase [Halomonas sp. PR-M31]